MDLWNRRQYIVMHLVNTERNRELLKTAPHREMMDLSVVYRIIISRNKFGLNTVLVSNEVMEKLGLAEKELDVLAYRNTVRLFPAKLSKFTEHLYMMTNRMKVYGATTMIYKDVMKALSQRVGENLFIIPSSVHEVMIVPEKSVDLKFLLRTLSENNRLYVEQREILSNNIYFYHRSRNIIGMAASYLP